MLQLLTLLLPVQAIQTNWSISPVPNPVSVTCSQYSCQSTPQYKLEGNIKTKHLPLQMQEIIERKLKEHQAFLLATDSQCLSYDETQDLYKLENCPNGQYCLVSGQTGACVQQTDFFTSIPPGGVCQISEQCWGNGQGALCSGNRCTYQKENQNCIAQIDCNPGLYCDYTSTTCLKQKSQGQACDSDFECANNLNCYVAVSGQPGVCQSPFSHNPGDIIANCQSLEYRTFLCSSGLCTSDPDGSNGKCISPVKVQSDICTSSSNCATSADTQSGTQMYTSCVCGKSNSKTAYCSKANGDQYWLEYLNIYKTSVLSSPALLSCNTDDREGLSCFQALGLDSDTYDELVYYQYLAYNSPELEHSDDCTLQALSPVYYTVYQNMNNHHKTDADDDDDYAAIIGLLGLILLGL